MKISSKIMGRIITIKKVGLIQILRNIQSVLPNGLKSARS